MAIQDQRQDPVLRRLRLSLYSAVLLGLTLCSLGFVIFVWASNSTYTEFFAQAQSRWSSQAAPSRPPANTPQLGEIKSVTAESEWLAPGQPPTLGYGASALPVPDAEEIRRRIAQVEAGFLPSAAVIVRPSERGPRQGRAYTVPGSPPPIVIEGRELRVQLQDASAGLWFDPATLGGSQVIMHFSDDSAGLLEAPLSGNGVMVDGQYVPPGGSIVVGTGSLIMVERPMGLHLRPVVLPIRPSGPG